jgi:hypothetical protein
MNFEICGRTRPVCNLRQRADISKVEKRINKQEPELPKMNKNSC